MRKLKCHNCGKRLQETWIIHHVGGIEDLFYHIPCYHQVVTDILTVVERNMMEQFHNKESTKNIINDASNTNSN